MDSAPDHLVAAAPLGLIAGEGELPFLVARGARAAGRGVVIVGIRGSASPELRALADRFCWRGIVQLGRWIRAFRSAGCRDVIMAGRVRKADMFAGPRWLQYLQYLPDLTSIRVWYRHARDKRNDTLLCAVADELGRRGLTLIDSTRYCREALAPAGHLAGPPASAAILADIDFGWPLAKQVAGLDIGQALAIKEREVIAVEAIEGTDQLIARTAALCPQGGWTLIKVAKPNQDMRFDVPTIGPQTIENLRAAGGRALCVEAEKTIVLERDRLTALAQRHSITVLVRR